MAKLTIENILCFGQRTEVEIAPGITIISGKNSSGKSCLTKILAALTAHNVNPAHISKTSKTKYITDGSEDGEATLETDDGTVKWLPADGITLTPADFAKQAEDGSVGIIDFVSITSPKDAAKVWEGLFLPSNPRDILEPKWTRPKAQLEAVIEIIQNNGWNDAIKMYDGQRLDSKRRWQKITGRTKYGKEVAANWVPENWSIELDGASIAKLTQNVADCQDVLNAMTSARAISQKEIEEARQIKDIEIPALQKEEADSVQKYEVLLDVYKKKHAEKQREVEQLEEIDKEIAALKQRLAGLKEMEDKHQKCPHCGGALRIDSRNMIVAHIAGDSETEVEEVEKRIKEQELGRNPFLREIAVMNEWLKPKRDELNALKEEVNKMRGKIDALKAMAAKADEVPSEAATEAQRTLAENNLEEAKAALTAYKSWKDAKKEHDNVVELEEICHLLSPDGARADIMNDAMGSVQRILDKISEITGWKRLGIGKDYSLSSGGRPIRLTAENECRKAQWSLQIATARLSKSRWCILDACDLLQDDSRVGLGKLAARLSAAQSDFHIVISGTNLSDMNLGEGSARIINIDEDHTIHADG